MNASLVHRVATAVPTGDLVRPSTLVAVAGAVVAATRGGISHHMEHDATASSSMRNPWQSPNPLSGRSLCSLQR